VPEDAFGRGGGLGKGRGGDGTGSGGQAGQPQDGTAVDHSSKENGHASLYINSIYQAAAVIRPFRDGYSTDVHGRSRAE
jgi:hypothetical protein